MRTMCFSALCMLILLFCYMYGWLGRNRGVHVHEIVLRCMIRANEVDHASSALAFVKAQESIIMLR